MNAIYKFVLGLIGKRSGVITALPNKKQIEFQANMLAEKFMQNGIDPNALKSPEQVKNVLANIDQANMKVIPGDSAEGKGITEKLLGKKKAPVFDMEGNKIPEGSKIMGGKEVKPINELQNYTKSKEEIVQDLVDRKFGKGYFDTVDESDAAIKARLDADNKKGIAGIKISLVDDSIARIKSMEPMDAMKEANLVAGKKGKYANLDDNQVKKIMDDTQDHIFQDADPLDDYATGGRVGLKGAGFINFIKNMTMNKKSPLQFGKDYLKNVKDKTLKANETGKFMDLPIAEVGIPAATGALVNNQIRKKLKNMNEDQKEENLKMFIMELENDEFYDKYPELKDEMIANYTERLFGVKKADGGRIGYKAGGIDKMRRLVLKAMGAGTAGIAAAKSGIFSGIGKGAGKTVAKEVAQQTTSSMPPAYFFKLAEKIKNSGDDVTKRFATKDREVVTNYQSKNGDFEMYEDLDTGDVRIKITKGDPDAPGYNQQELTLTKGQADETTKVTPADEYDEYTVKSDFDGKMKDIEDGLDDIEDIIDEIGVENITVKDLEKAGYIPERLPYEIRKKLGIKDAPSIKYASGGLAYMLGE